MPLPMEAVLAEVRESSQELLSLLQLRQLPPDALVARRGAALRQMAEFGGAEAGEADEVLLAHIRQLDASILEAGRLLRAQLADEAARLQARGAMRQFAAPGAAPRGSLDLTA